jgi:hypothetical protein
VNRPFTEENIDVSSYEKVFTSLLIKEMLGKTTMKYQAMHTSLSKIRKTDSSKWEQAVEANGILVCRS